MRPCPAPVIKLFITSSHSFMGEDLAGRKEEDEREERPFLLEDREDRIREKENKNVGLIKIQNS